MKLKRGRNKRTQKIAEERVYIVAIVSYLKWQQQLKVEQTPETLTLPNVHIVVRN